MYLVCFQNIRQISLHRAVVGALAHAEVVTPQAAPCIPPCPPPRPLALHLAYPLPAAIEFHPRQSAVAPSACAAAGPHRTESLASSLHHPHAYTETPMHIFQARELPHLGSKPHLPSTPSRQ